MSTSIRASRALTTSIVILAVVAAAAPTTVLGVEATTTWAHTPPTPVDPRVTNGLISFDRPDPASEGDTYAYVVGPAGGKARRLLPTHTCCAGWSPDGRKLVLPRLTRDDRIGSAVVRSDGSGYQPLPIPDPTLNIGCGTGSWAPDGKTLTCEVWDEGDPARNGMYTISARTGRIVTRVTANPVGGTDIPGGYSPSGKRIAFVRFDGDGNGLGLFVVRATGAGLRRITAAGSSLNIGADWSPRRQILFSRHVTPSARGSLWAVRPDGSRLRRIDVRGMGCGGALDDPAGIGCHGARWSPDGRFIVFAAGGDDGTDIYVARPSGAHLVQITTSGGDNPEWGRAAR
jgi:Tol biopolymer transport system component